MFPPTGQGTLVSPSSFRVPAHVATTRHLCAAYPLVSEAGLGHEGVLIGRDVLGGSFVYDPFALYRRGVVTNPNMVVIGQIGRGKSSFVKTYLWRQAVFGRRAWVVDPKGEYSPLARAWGVEPVALRPGGSVRLNPLDTETAPGGAGAAGAGNTGAAGAGSAGAAGEIRARGGEGSGRGTGAGCGPEVDGEPGVGAGQEVEGDPGVGSEPDAVMRRRVMLTSSLAVACLGRELLPKERAAIDAALAEATRMAGSARMPAPTLPQVVDALLEPHLDAALALRTTPNALTEDGRDVALELRRLVRGDLCGMFDGPTTPGLRLDGPLVVLDLSAVYHSPALGVLMACAAAWLQTAVLAENRNRIIVVVDEAWAILSNLGVARWLQTSWKMSRAMGVANVAVLHRLSDLRAVGSIGSEQVNLAEGLLADSETRVVYAQPPGEVALTGELLGLTETEADLVSQLRRGMALWKVGRRSFLVEHRLAPGESVLTDTDQAMNDDELFPRHGR